jgi:hypothetical protein
MKRLLGLACLFTLMLGGALVVPLPSEAKPTLTIAGQTLPDADLQPITCPTGYNSCWSIAGTATGRNINNIVIVKDVSSTNRARVLINDVGTVGSVDAMKLTGVTLTPVIVAGDKTITVVIRNQYSAGQPKGDYKWAMGMGGYFDPPSTENVVGDRLRLIGTGVFPDTVTMGTLDTGSFTTSTILNVNGSVTRSLSATTVKSACDTGGGFCRPTITYTFTIVIRGGDTLVLNDSVIGAGGTCREEGSPTDVPPGTPDPVPPAPVCKAVENQINQVIHKDMLDSIKSAKAAGAVVAEACVGACGNGTIIIQVNTPIDGIAGFHATGEDMQDFDIEATSGFGSKTFSNLSTGVIGGSRTITEIVFPDILDFLGSVDCTTPNESGTTWNHVFDDGEAVVGITVSNLADGDTLTCTFVNFNAGA